MLTIDRGDDVGDGKTSLDPEVFEKSGEGQAVEFLQVDNGGFTGEGEVFEVDEEGEEAGDGVMEAGGEVEGVQLDMAPGEERRGGGGGVARPDAVVVEGSVSGVGGVMVGGDRGADLNGPGVSGRGDEGSVGVGRDEGAE